MKRLLIIIFMSFFLKGCFDLADDLIKKCANTRYQDANFEAMLEICEKEYNENPKKFKTLYK